MVSAIMPVTCGVPQESHLGPLLFIIYDVNVNDLLNATHHEVTIFADDTHQSITQIYIKARGPGKGCK